MHVYLYIITKYAAGIGMICKSSFHVNLKYHVCFNMNHVSNKLIIIL